MDEKNLFSKLTDIVTVYLPEDVRTDRITESSRLMDELNINSAHLVDIALDVEDAFDITLTNEDLERLITVGDVVTVVREKIAVRGN